MAISKIDINHLTDTEAVYEILAVLFSLVQSQTVPSFILKLNFFWATNILKFVWNSIVVFKFLASSVFVAHHVPQDFIHYVKYNIVSFFLLT